MCSAAASCTPTTRWCRCWRRGRERRGRLWTYVRDDRPSSPRIHRRFGSRTRRIARAIIRNSICGIFPAVCKPMPTPDSTSCTQAGASRKSPAGLMCAASSTIWTRHTPHRWRGRPSSALESSMRLRARSAAVRRMNGEPRGRRDRNLCWTPCGHGSRAACRSYRASLILPPRSVTRSHFVMLLYIKDAVWRSITTPPTPLAALAA